MRAHFDIQLPTPKGIVAIADRGDGAMAVTNDAEAVVAHLIEHGHLAPSDRLIYRDTDGQWDELVHREGRFVTRNHVGMKTLEGAVRVMLERIARAARPPASLYPADWAKCPACGEPALDGHITCGAVACAEGKRRPHIDLERLPALSTIALKTLVADILRVAPVVRDVQYGGHWPAAVKIAQEIIEQREPAER